MRRSLLWLSLAGWLAAALCAPAANGRVIKVLPQFLDLKGRNSLTPGLFERDSYQARLRNHTNECSGMQFKVQWKTSGRPVAPLRVQVELRGVARGDFPRQLVLTQSVEPRKWFSRWATVPLVGQDYKDFGEVTAWRATLWEGNRLLGEQRSFLW
ncbi:MAG TPA: hypothetical protein P5205_10675 [Candidatus Paceibacterota bacterium]|nr:hypothetical protein [Verrucomicrobiota bacterium]HSA10820.1 hypothetical protein [Candidatus Paceibacterota bacterium]